MDREADARVSLTWKTRAVGGLLAALTYIGAFGVFFVGFATVQMLVHPFNHSRHQLSWIWETMRDNSPLPVVLCAGVVLLFALDVYLAKRSGTLRAGRERFGASRLFLFGTLAVFLTTTLFWMTDARYMPPRLWGSPDLVQMTWALLPAALTCGILFGLAARYGPSWFWWLTFAAPAAALAAGVALARAVARASGAYAMELPVAWPTIGLTLGALAVLVLLVGVAGFLEKRTLGELRRSAELLLVGLWLIAVAVQYMTVALFQDCLCRMSGPPEVERAAVLGVLGVFGVALVLRVLLHARQIRERRSRVASSH
jgi:hypothetical protein